MGTIQFKEVNCKNCYKCIRSCPVKAISVKNDHAQIIEDECILCGKCLQVCPQNAKSVKSEVDKVKGYIEKNLKVYVSIAPSFAPAFNIKSEKNIYGLFRKLGFTHVEETAIGAARVSLEYKKLIQEKKMTNIITTACSTIVSLIEKQYPELVEQMAPVVSPMIAHGKMMKEMYGSRIKVVFIGPCLSKKEEYKDFQNDEVIDAVITFEELEKWIKDEQLSFDDEYIEGTGGQHNTTARYYPAPGGIIKSLGIVRNCNYRLTKFDGIDRCINILDEIRNEKVKNYFIEMNSCMGGCLGGACMNSECPGFLELKDRLLDFVKRSSAATTTCMEYNTKVSLAKSFKSWSSDYRVPDEKVIQSLLNKIGKFDKKDELNCGGCGYTTCRDKAIAVFNGKAELHMCIPYMKERAESISNVIINSTPNAIFALTEDLQIFEVNLSAKKIFNLESEDLQNKNVWEILDCPDIVIVSETKEDILNSKYYYERYNVTVEQSILYIEENHMLILIIRDITSEEEEKKQMYKVRSEMVDIAQKVIDKQMRVAQEIASLLGETTAETKVALTKLKKSIQPEMSESK